MEKVDYINVSQYKDKIDYRYQLMFSIYNFENKTVICKDITGRLNIVLDSPKPTKFCRQFSFTIRK